MNLDRKTTLLREIADQFENAETPMNNEWLCRNKVTLDECGDLMDACAHLIRSGLGVNKALLTMVRAMRGNSGERQ